MIEVVPYDPNWPLMFEIEKGRIVSILKDNCIEIHHIGSTSVPGLSAKPKIDMVVIARQYANIIPDMKQIGYQYRGEWNIPFKFGFVKRGDIDVNLHMFFDKNHPEVELNVRFRDYLRTHPEARKAYEDIKYQILEEKAAHEKTGKLNIPIYTIRKREFIDQILRQMGYDRLRILKCLTEKEWEAAERLKNNEISEKERINENIEHFLLYKGIEILAYAEINVTSKDFKIFGDLEKSQDSFFKEKIKNWLIRLCRQ